MPVPCSRSACAVPCSPEQAFSAVERRRRSVPLVCRVAQCSAAAHSTTCLSRQVPGIPPPQPSNAKLHWQVWSSEYFKSLGDLNGQDRWLACRQCCSGCRCGHTTASVGSTSSAHCRRCDKLCHARKMRRGALAAFTRGRGPLCRVQGVVVEGCFTLLLLSSHHIKLQKTELRSKHGRGTCQRGGWLDP